MNSVFNRRKVFIPVLFIALTALSMGKKIQAAESNNFTPLQCSLTGLGELILPGVGYAITGQYGKAVTIGGMRWILSYNANSQEEDKNYQDDPDEFYYNDTITQEEIDRFEFLEDEDKDKELTLYVYNKATFYQQHYARLSGNLGLYSFWDLTDGNCDPNPDWQKPFLAFTDYETYGSSPFFWGALGAIFISLALNDDVSAWYLGDGLRYSEIAPRQYLNHYSVGIGEETFFRGSLQKSIYNIYQSYLSDYWAWHWGVLTSAVIFGLAHNGESGSANAIQASLGGILLGYAYQPSPNDLQLTTSIVIHTLWNMSVVYLSHRNKRKVVESEEAYTADDVRYGRIPLFNFGYNF